MEEIRQKGSADRDRVRLAMIDSQNVDRALLKANLFR